MEQLIPWLIFCMAVLLLCLFRPGAARIFVGVFFIIMAVGVNTVLSVTAPEQHPKNMLHVLRPSQRRTAAKGALT
ncbi:hypothetical protein [Paenarthrobacter sp. 4246]|uniref:hypothetical protein n=1 Tax=Paenarthrobacter sp. 4246 TaxID=3156456 RepID=UPI00339B227E